jgi:hypothetical protein
MVRPVFVDHDDLAVLHDVLDVAVEQLVGAQAGVHVVSRPRLCAEYRLAFGQQADLVSISR